MRNVNICLIALASLLFLLINLYGLLEILRYFKLKQLRDLKDRLKENRIRGENPNWHTLYTSTSQYDLDDHDYTTKKHNIISKIHFLSTISPKVITSTVPSTTISDITSTTTEIEETTTTRIHVTTHKIIPQTITSHTVPSTIRVTTKKHDFIPEVTTPRIIVTTKPDWFEDSRQIEERRRQNAERRRQQYLQEEQNRRLKEEEEKKRIEQDIEERKRKEEAEREKIRWLGEERRRKEHKEKMEARRLKALEEQKQQMILQQARERAELEAKRRSEEEKQILAEVQKKERERLEAEEKKELLKKQHYEKEQRRLAELQHLEREKLREELHAIAKLREQQKEEAEEGKTIQMSLEEDYDDQEDEDFKKTVKTTTEPQSLQENQETSVSASQEPYHIEGDWSVGRHRHTSTSSPVDDLVETPEPPRNDEITIVTALLDIGRGDWFHYQRPLEKYHEFMENLLSLQNNMVIFTDHSSYDFIHKYRKNLGLMPMTRIHLVNIDDLPLSRHLPYAQKIIEDEMNNDELYLHDPDMKNHPEAKSAEYDIVVNSKTYFLYNTTLEDPFQTDFFVWIDAGYGHGNQNVYPYDNFWKPTFPRNKISMIKLTPEHDSIKNYKIDNLYRRNWSVVSGGFIAGDKRSIGQLYTVTHNKFIHLIYQNKVDDDQTVMVLAINSYPHLFDIKQGDWFDAFRLYSDPATPFGQKF